MNEFQQGVREAVKALKIMARGIEIFANAFEKSIEKYEQEAAPPDPEAPKSEKPEAEKKATAGKKPKTAKPAGAKKGKPATARKTGGKKKTAAKDKPVADREKLRRIIVRSKEGADIETLVKKTGFAQRKVSQMAFHLKKEGKIKNPKKGFYTKP